MMTTDNDCDHPRTLRRALEEHNEMKDRLDYLDGRNPPEVDVKAGPVHARMRGYRIMDIVMVLAFGLAGVGAWFVYEHDRNSSFFQNKILKAVEDNTAAIRFQTCVSSVDQAQRILQLRKYSACWYMGQGYGYEETIGKP